MIRVDVPGGGSVEINPEEYTGDIHDFLRKIFKRIIPNLTEETYNNKYRGKFSLITLDGRLLSPGVKTKGQKELSPEDIKNIINDSSRLRILVATLPLRPKKDEQIIQLENDISQMKEELKVCKTLNQKIEETEKELELLLKKKPSFVQGGVEIVEEGNIPKGGRRKRTKKGGKKRTKKRVKTAVKKGVKKRTKKGVKKRV